nr:ABC transporter (iron.B12.siderophore.hemin), periplasmic substrate-binding component [Kibdelosporangium sp. MJ126-NF4]CTQ98015.1 ABC transporter (iron.B12.siderophore.hemin), periplasmic substrate-binding component [Kibdelosporangium sp. MJ126-NF4]
MLSTACGGQSAAPAAPPPPLDTAVVTAKPTTYPLTIDNCGRKITFDRAPSRVLLLNGASVGEVESFVTLGIQDRILANSQSYGVSEQPEMVDRIKAVPTAGLKLNENFAVPREQVLALRPDLVVSTSAHGFDEKTGAATRDQLDSQGIKSLVTPVNCAFGAPSARPEDTERYKAQSVESSFELLRTLGEIFDVQQRAADHITKARADITAVQKRVDGKPRKNVLVAFPGMAMMNNNGLPAIFGGGIYDDIVARAGGVNPFGGKDTAALAEINAEALATATVDVLVIGVYQASENPDTMAADLFAKFPNWQASKTRTYTSVSDGIYLGPLNALAVAKIADVAHRDR